MAPLATRNIPATQPDPHPSPSLHPETKTIYVGASTVMLPAFFKDDPAAWFAVIESSFLLKKITDLITKYHHAVSKLDAETASTVRELRFVRANPGAKTG